MTASARDIIFNHSERVAPLGLIAIPGSEELGKKVNDYLVTWSREAGYDYDNFLIENECPRFSSGDGKALIKNTVRGYDVYIIADFGNYSLEYPLFGRMNRMSPDDHFQTSSVSYRLSAVRLTVSTLSHLYFTAEDSTEETTESRLTAL